MLNKSICKKCHSEWDEWNKHDEERWENGKVWCPGPSSKREESKFGVSDVSGIAPEWCLYIAEQIVSEEC